MLTMLSELDAPPMHAGTPETARTGFRQLTVGTRTPEQAVPVGSVEDRDIAGADGPLPARVYRPEGAGPFPIVAFFHGGGWVIGDLDTHDNLARHICRAASAIVVSVDYRLAPEHRFPAAAEDAVAVTRWLAGHSGEFGGDGRLAVAGDSAGGNLSAVAAQQLTRDGTPLAGQFLIYPAVDVAGSYPSRVENAEGYFLDQPMMEWFLGHYAG
ncbi:MAG: alpha/beta hydrolase, partial [Actinobacteria bacterium]|nr:alpha/beta hydrolase [Actinomycetota bacterium]